MSRARLALAVAVALVAATPAFGQGVAASPAAQLQNEVSAVLDTESQPRLLLVETANGVQSQRILRIGEEYRDGWRLAGLTADQATLTRREEIVRVDLRKGRKPAPERQEPPIAVAALNSGTASAQGTTVAGAVPSSDAVAAAIFAGDPAKVVSAGGRPDEVLDAALRGKMASAFYALDKHRRDHTGELVYLNARGRLGFGVMQGGLRIYGMTVAGLGEPPADAVVVEAGLGPPLERYLGTIRDGRVEYLTPDERQARRP